MTRRPANRSARAGGILVRLLVIVALAASVFFVQHRMSVSTAEDQACKDNLRSLFRALELYEMDRGTLPTLAFFPDDPQNDADSLRTILEPYGAEAHFAICPATHPVLRDLGLTYVWNHRLNAKRIPRSGPPRWMLIEMTAAYADLPAPHSGHYNVLFTDGTVREVHNPLQEFNGL